MTFPSLHLIVSSLVCICLLGSALGQTTTEGLIGFSCTSGDVQVTGVGNILNQPCPCNAGDTFTARVAFPVRNTANSNRSCITLYMCPNPAAGFNNSFSVELSGALTGKQSDVLVGNITNFPCPVAANLDPNGLLCFGSNISDGSGKCTSCCDTVTWRVPGQDPDCDVFQRVISSKCRHQYLCIAPRSASLHCLTSPITDTCTAGCDGTVNLQMCVNGMTGPFTYTLGSTTVQDANRCHNFTGVTVSASGPLTASVTGSTVDGSCTLSDSVTIQLASIAAPALSTSGPDCSGRETVTITNCNSSQTYRYQVDGGTNSSMSCSQAIPLPQDGDSHNITIYTSKDGCSAKTTTSSIFSALPLAVSLGGFTQTGCTGAGTFAATCTGGTSAFTFAFSQTPAGGSSQALPATCSGAACTTNPVGPFLDGVCHTVAVTVTDSKGCTASDSQKITQCAHINTNVGSSTCPSVPGATCV